MRHFVRFLNKARFLSRSIMEEKKRPVVTSIEMLRNFKSASEFQLGTPEFNEILTPEVHCLGDIFNKYGYDVRIAGGAVRDLLLGMMPKDLDFATPATPSEMKEMFNKENIRMINAAGEKHGTITARINNYNFEVTTLRIDKVTHGRRADVEFIKNWEPDANRRDFTINSMFLDLGGNVYDYCNGLEDLKNRRVRFVGLPEKRIQEDYLRIMRYFRISKDPFHHDDATIAAIKDNKKELNSISGERIWSELQKTLEGNYGPDLLHFMLDVGLGPLMGFPDELDLNAFADFRRKLEKIDERLKAITLICALLRTSDELLTLRQRLKISNFDRDCGLFVMQHRDAEVYKNDLRYFRIQLVATNGKTADVREYVEQVLLYKGLTDTLKEFREWTVPTFPIKGDAIRNVCQITNVRHIGVLIRELKHYWAERDFEPTEEDLLNQLPVIYGRFKENKKQKVN